jgi:hypothetical protein
LLRWAKSAVGECQREVWIEPDGYIEIGESAIVLAALPVGIAPVKIGERQARRSRAVIGRDPSR